MPVTDNRALTHPSPAPPGMGSVLERNLRRMRARRANEEAHASLSERLSDRITSFAGSMTFVGLHAVAYGTWIAANLGWMPGVRPFDPSFVILAMEASVEAIFLSTFVLISQNRMMSAAAKQSDLDLQINLLAEHELDPDDYAEAQAVGAALREAGSDALVYPSVRDPGGQCVGLFYFDRAGNVVQARHLDYDWNGTRVDLYRDAGSGAVCRVG